MKKLLIILALLLLGWTAALAKETFPKLANYYLPWDVTDQQAQDLAKWDLVVLHTQALDRNPNLLKILKAKNPNIKILAYFPAQEINNQSLNFDPTGAWGKIFQATQNNNWWLRDVNNNYVGYWPGNNLINVTNPNFATWLPTFINQNYLHVNPLWDGIFYDNCWPGISWLNKSLDLNQDQQADAATLQDQVWQKVFNDLLSQTRKIIGPNKLLVCNGGTTYKNNYDGRMYETFPLNNEGGWEQNIKDYQTTGPYSIIDSNGQNQEVKTDYQKMRFGYTSSLLGNGYFAYDFGDTNHGQLWWYDEYESYLGKPLGPAKLLNNNNNHQNFPVGLWQRDFEQGLVLVNSGNQVQTIQLDAQYQKIKGQQDLKTNDGGLADLITVQPQDGLILLKTIASISNINFPNGYFINIFNDSGRPVRNGFFAYDEEIKGGQNINYTDLDQDGQPEKLVQNKNNLYIYNSNNNLLRLITLNQQKQTLPWQVINFTPSSSPTKIISLTKKLPASLAVFSGTGRLEQTINLADKKINVNDFAVCANNKLLWQTAGRSGQIVITNNSGKIIDSFYPFSKTGLNLTIACADINNDQQAEYIVGQIGSGLIRIFDQQKKKIKEWSALKRKTAKFNLQSADIDGDGKYEIIIIRNII